MRTTAAGPQIELFDDFTTARPGNPIYCHEEFLEKLEANRNNSIGRRAALLLHRLVVDERRQHYKSTAGVNRGWRRSRLGGSGGSHFYAWWTPKGAPPLKGLSDFESAPDGAIFLRDLRHHDDHTEARPHAISDRYLLLTVKELRRAEYAPLPWTPAQTKFSSARAAVRIVKGFPGSGKTTALWNAADAPGAQSILYITYSAELSALAQDHFEKFASSRKRFRVVTFPNLFREILEDDSPRRESETRAAFLKSIAGFSPRILGPWLNNKRALFDEAHAHLFGEALPIAAGRFAACPEPRLPDKLYRENRDRAVGRPAAEALLETVSTLSKRDGEKVEDRYFPELVLAWRALRSLLDAGAPPGLQGFDCIALDEAQDLTPIEAMAAIQLAASIQASRKHLVLLAAGDEAQTVRPTDFEWGWFHDLLHHRLGTPAEFKLGANLRSPRRIAELVNQVWDLYGHLSKQDRPSTVGLAEIDEDASDQVIYCSAAPGQELNELLHAFADREGLALISLDDSAPDYIPEKLRHKVLTVAEAKGLDFQSVCVLDGGKALQRITRTRDLDWRGMDIEPLTKRLEIDQLRVALSRPTERLYWLDVRPGDKVVGQSSAFLRTSPVVPAVVLKTLEEEILDPEERVRLCETDALQFLAVKPDLAWSRAKQAVSLLGERGSKHGILDDTVRQSAHATLARISFCLAFRRISLGAELGRPDLYGDAAINAELAGRPILANLIRKIGDHERCYAEVKPIIPLAFALAAMEGDLESWLRVEIAPKTKIWVETLEGMIDQGGLAWVLGDLLPKIYRVLDLSDSEQRASRIAERAIHALIASGNYESALKVLGKRADPPPQLLAQCHEGLGDFRSAAQQYERVGNLKEALRSYRAIPDFEKSLEVAAMIKDHPAAASLSWIRQLERVVEQRPEEFPKVILPSEKRMLEGLLERSLGVSRKKMAPRKTAKAKPPGRSKKKST